MTEREFVEGILPALAEAVKNRGGLGEWVVYEKFKKYTSVYLQQRNTIFRVRLRGTKHFILIPDIFSKTIPEEYPTDRVKSFPDYIRILIDKNHPAKSYTEFLTRLAGETVDHIPNEFDCCDRYMECSDAKVCILPDNDRDVAVRCGYRKILNSGRIFYGMNRNID